MSGRYTYECRCHGPEDAVRFPGAGLICSCETPDMVLGTELRSSAGSACAVDQCSVFLALIFVVVVTETGSPCAAQADLKFMILLLLPHGLWDYS